MHENQIIEMVKVCHHHCFNSNFSIVCFTDHGDITSNEMVEDQMVETTLKAALHYDDIIAGILSQLPVSSEDFQQV